MPRFFLAVCWVLLLACDDSNQQVVSIVLEDATPEQQGTIGDALQRATDAEFNILDRSDPEYETLYAYLNAHLRALVVHPVTQRRDLYAWDVTVVHNDTLRTAWTLPGGHLYVTSGLFRYLRDETELVALLAHELHYADSDVAVNKLIGTKAIGGARLGDLLLGQTPDDLPNVVRTIAELEFDEGDVLNADARAIRTVCPLNYRTTGLWNLLERALDPESSAELVWFDTRPADPQARYAQLEVEMAQCDPGGLENAFPYERFLAMLP